MTETEKLFGKPICALCGGDLIQDLEIASIETFDCDSCDVWAGIFDDEKEVGFWSIDRMEKFLSGSSFEECRRKGKLGAFR